MSKAQITALLGEWEGYKVGTIQRFEAGQKGPKAQVWIELLPEKKPALVCSGCGQVSHLAAFYGPHWEAVKRIDKQHLQETLGPPNLAGVEAIVMDEFAIQKGHRYATVIAEPYTKRVLWVGRGRGRKDVRPFFEALGPEGRCHLKAVVMDMNGAYEEEVRYQCPFAEIVYDLFHVVAKYGREVIDRVRVDQANQLRRDKKPRQVVKSSRWLLLRNKQNISRKKGSRQVAETVGGQSQAHDGVRTQRRFEAPLGLPLSQGRWEHPGFGGMVGLLGLRSSQEKSRIIHSQDESEFLGLQPDTAKTAALEAAEFSISHLAQIPSSGTGKSSVGFAGKTTALPMEGLLP